MIVHFIYLYFKFSAVKQLQKSLIPFMITLLLQLYKIISSPDSFFSISLEAKMQLVVLLRNHKP